MKNELTLLQTTIEKWAKCETPQNLLDHISSENDVNSPSADPFQFLEAFFKVHKEEFIARDITALQGLVHLLKQCESEECSKEFNEEEKISALVGKIQKVIKEVQVFPEIQKNLFGIVVDYLPTLYVKKLESFLAESLPNSVLERIEKEEVERKELAEKANKEIRKIAHSLPPFEGPLLKNPEHFNELHRILRLISPEQQCILIDELTTLYNGNHYDANYKIWIHENMPKMQDLICFCKGKNNSYPFNFREIQLIKENSINLERLDIALHEETILESIKLIATFPSLKVLTIENDDLDTKSYENATYENVVRALVDGANKSNLEILYFHSKDFNETCLRMLAQSPNFPKLKRIIIEPSFLEHGRALLAELDSNLELIPYISDQYG